MASRGYGLLEIPQAPVDQRVAFILQNVISTFHRRSFGG